MNRDELPTFTVNDLSVVSEIVRPTVSVAIKAYYDGSGSSSDPWTPAVTLAGYAAPPDVWDRFDAGWPKMLAGDGSRPSCRYLHMAELMSVTRSSDDDNEYKDWTDAHCWQLVLDTYKFIYSKAWNRDIRFKGLVCTVRRDDLSRACRVIAGLEELSPEEICTDHVVMWAIQMIPNDATRPTGKAGSVHLIFDRNEPFKASLMPHMAKKWHKRNSVMQCVVAVTEAASEETPALQAADYLAWNTNRARTATDQSGFTAQALRVISSDIEEAFYGYENLIQTYRRGWLRD